MRRLYTYIAITTAFYLLSFVGVSVWFWYHISDANVSAAFFVFEPDTVMEEPFEPYIRHDGTYGQVSEFFPFRESDLYKRVKERHKGEIYYSEHTNYEGKYIYTYCSPLYKDGKFVGVFGMDVPIRYYWLITVSFISLLGIIILIFCIYHIYENVRKMAIKDTLRDGQIRLAAELQQQILPAEMPKHPALDISTLYQPAQNIGGDLYDVRLENGNTLIFCIGDISGHGIPAALLMSQVVGIFRSSHGSPAEIMNTLNGVMADNNPDMQFCTIFIGQLNLTNGLLTFCNAGHPIPNFSFHGQPLSEIDSAFMSDLHSPFQTICPPLGVDLSTNYYEQTTLLPMGITLNLFTDGVYGDEDDDITRLDITWKAYLGNLHPWLMAYGLTDNMSELAIEEALANVVKHSTATAIALLPTTPLHRPSPSITDIHPLPTAHYTFLLLDNGDFFNPTTAISHSDGVGLNLVRELAVPVYERKGDLNCLTLSVSVGEGGKGGE